MDTPFSTPVENLQHWAQVRPDELAFIFLEQGEIETDRLTFAELDQSSRQMAAHLQTISQPGDRALLLFPTGLDFVKALFGSLYAGVIPIPTNPPGLNRSARRLDAIARDAQASIALTTPEFRQSFIQRDENLPDLMALRWVEHASIEANPGAAWRKSNPSPGDLAFIQYTSGSTNIPKGVMISYRNLSHNRYAIRDFRRREKAKKQVILTWNPLFHDMGLLFGVFQGVFEGQLNVLMSPIAFIQKPVRWLNAISKYKATCSAGPNFSYEVCVNKITPDECQGLDLSSWRTACNGAEPVRAETQARFVEKFSPFGFRPETFSPAYGLAEATLILSGRGGSKNTVTVAVDRDAFEQGKIIPWLPGEKVKCQELVSCGPPLIGIQAVIVNPQTCLRCPPDEIGEIWTAGDSMAEGYWNRPQETEDTFRAMIKDTGEGPFLRTGDLGFIQAGEIYVTGRQKDLIIIRGRNYYPQDVEYTVQKSHLALQPGGGAAFSIEANGMEQLVVVQEVREKYLDHQSWDEIIKKIRFDIAREHGIRAYSVALIQRTSIPKTSSGKIMRSECRRLFLENQLETVAEWRAPSS